MLTLGIICPCYNEEDVLCTSAKVLSNYLNQLVNKNKISKDSFVLLVNDGSKDKTWKIINNLYNQKSYFKGLNLASNVGHQNAIMAGMMTAKDKCDAIITMDVDLQDDINAIEEMIDYYEKGYDIVYGVKKSREADSFFKKNTAIMFYKLQKSMGINSIYNHADFRLLSNRALNQLSKYKERNLYLRGIIPMMGYPSATVDDYIKKRTAGSSKYTLNKMLKLALDGITSFSIKPISLIVCMGLMCILICIIMLLHSLYVYFTGQTIPGWTSIMISIWFLGGLLLLSVGTIGIYIGKIYIEIKNRPLYNIETLLWD